MHLGPKAQAKAKAEGMMNFGLGPEYGLTFYKDFLERGPEVREFKRKRDWGWDRYKTHWDKDGDGELSPDEIAEAKSKWANASRADERLRHWYQYFEALDAGLIKED